MKIVIIGSGYVGLVAAVCFAELGHQVQGIDTDSKRITDLQKGQSPIYEPGLDALLKKHTDQKFLSFRSDLNPAIVDADIAFICVGTPQREDGKADMTFIEKVSIDLGQAIAKRPENAAPLVVVNKSTVPLGTVAMVSEMIAEEIQRLKTNRPFEVVSNPEFLKEGDALNDFMFPDRVVLGCTSDHAEKLVKELYAPFLAQSKGQWFRMDPPSAELTKYASNAMLAMRISFMNEMANLAEKAGGNIESVKVAVGADKRIGPYFLDPGPGFGGSCFPKDVRALLESGVELGESMLMLKATLETNTQQKKVVLHKLCDALRVSPSSKPFPLRGKQFTVWGLAFKAKTDDVRESVSLELIHDLISLGAKVVAHDVLAIETAKQALGIIPQALRFEADLLKACQGSDGLIVLTEWSEYKTADLEEAGQSLKAKLMIDGRNLYDPATMKHQGWSYHSLGRPTL